MTIQEAREQVAKKWKYRNWLELHIKVGGTEMDAFSDEAAELYADSKVKKFHKPLVMRCVCDPSKYTRTWNEDIGNDVCDNCNKVFSKHFA